MNSLSKISNLIQLLVSVISCSLQTFSGIFIEKTTFGVFVEICEQIRKEKEIQYNDEKEMIESNINLMTNFY